MPADLDFDAWQGPAPMVPYTVDRATRFGGFHCPETSLGFLAGCAIHELGLAQWGNKSDHTSPIRYAGTGSVPSEGIFRTLGRWDVTCDYPNGVKLRFMDFRTAKPVTTDHFRIAVFGDSGDGSQNQKDVATRLLQVQPDLVLHTGDLIYPEASYNLFETNFFQIYDDVLQSVWLAPSMGNHDVTYNNGKSFTDVFVNPPNATDPAQRELYYSFDYGNAHFVILNNYFKASTVGSPQYNWLRNDLAASGGMVTVAKVRQKRQETHEATGQGSPVPRTIKQLRSFLEGKTGPAAPDHKLAAYLLDYLAGKKSDDNLGKYWDKVFPGANG